MTPWEQAEAVRFGCVLASVVALACAPGAPPPPASLPLSPPQPAEPHPAEALAPLGAAAPGSSSPAPIAAPSSPCPPGMLVSEEVCVDRFEAPNEEGKKPLTMTSATEAEAWCAARGKRLCSEREWRRACTGPSPRKFPYGDVHKKGACNDDKPYLNPSWTKLARWPAETARSENARLDQSEAAGARPECVSGDGERDMVGNVAEWVKRSEDHPNNHPHVVVGCSWTKCYRPPHTPTCDYVNYNHPSEWRSYEIGFRCCAPKT